MRQTRNTIGWIAAAVLAMPSAALAADFGRAQVAAPPVYGPTATDSCYAIFHRHKHGTGRSLERVGPESIPVVRHLHYHNGASLNSRVLSVTAGPGAQVALYKGRDYRRYMFTVAPGTVANLSLGVMDSYRIRCTQQAYVPHATPVVPGYK